uniref:Putative secreted protein n=1 Tax=Anopheles triannulatus TaxID=58253 RepID=A0A2M4B6I4_9DIPT
MLMPRDVFWLMFRWPIRFAQWSTGFLPLDGPSLRNCSRRLVLPIPCTPTTINFMRAYGRASSYTDLR